MVKWLQVISNMFYHKKLKNKAVFSLIKTILYAFYVVVISNHIIFDCGISIYLLVNVRGTAGQRLTHLIS